MANAPTRKEEKGTIASSDAGKGSRDRFNELMTTVLAIPKSELDRREAKWKRRRKRKPRDK
jgi:hypothetical protein